MLGEVTCSASQPRQDPAVPELTIQTTASIGAAKGVPGQEDDGGSAAGCRG